ncbi:MAG TPA: CHAT domain-containing protein, partial [Acidimicrobiia bacterium]
AAAGAASLVAARAALALGDHETAGLLLRKVAAERTGPVELRVSGWVARALLALEAGDHPGAGRAIRRGLALVDRYQAALGATDLRMGIERQTRDLASLGMGLALESRNPRRILAWMDRTRARSLRHRPVAPSGETGLDELLARLRQVDAGIRQTGTADIEQTRQRRRLQEEIARVARTERGEEDAGRGVTVPDMLDSLGDASLIELGVHEGSLFGIHARDGRVRRFQLGDYDTVVREMEHLRFAMRLSARRGRSLDLAPLDDLDHRILGRLDIGDEAVVVVPHPGLMALPWAALPRLRGRALAVSPSAEMWVRARGRSRRDGRVVVVGGPDLETAHREVREVGRLHPMATVLEPGVGVLETWEALDGAALAHVASHAVFAVENPMFSSLRLGDGDLNVYDLERLYRPPDLVVLSACDSGYSETRAGDELTGLTSALLSMGTRTVVASVGLVPDSDATPDLMVAFHEALVRGVDPASALAGAQETMFADPETFVTAASFVCVGA